MHTTKIQEMKNNDKFIRDSTSSLPRQTKIASVQKSSELWLSLITVANQRDGRSGVKNAWSVLFSQDFQSSVESRISNI